jgi:hypothetical protein
MHGKSRKTSALHRRWPGSALVLIPESVNFFNNIAGQRLAEALRRLGWDVKLLSLKNYAGERADVAFLVSLVELFVSCESPREARANLHKLRRNCDRVLMWLLEPTGTRWFNSSYDLFRECGLKILADNALHDQGGELAPEQRCFYHHLFYGLTESEKRQVRSAAFDDEARTIPWVFVGYKTPERCEMARFLVEEVDRGGFLYLTDVVPITETGPHIKDGTFQQVLRRCRYQLWRAHHSSFYMEGERFRRSALAGCVPIKIVVEDAPGERELPFPYLVAEKDDLPERLDPKEFGRLRARFLDEYCARPSLEDELRRFLATMRGMQRVASIRVSGLAA